MQVVIQSTAERLAAEVLSDSDAREAEKSGPGISDHLAPGRHVEAVLQWQGVQHHTVSSYHPGGVETVMRGAGQT